MRSWVMGSAPFYPATSLVALSFPNSEGLSSYSRSLNSEFLSSARVCKTLNFSSGRELTVYTICTINFGIIIEFLMAYLSDLRFYTYDILTSLRVGQLVTRHLAWQTDEERPRIKRMNTLKPLYNISWVSLISNFWKYSKVTNIFSLCFVRYT